MPCRYKLAVVFTIGILLVNWSASAETELSKRLQSTRQQVERCEGIPKDDRASCQEQARLQIDLLSVEISHEHKTDDASSGWVSESIKVFLGAIGGAIGALLGVWSDRRRATDAIKVRTEKLQEILLEVKAVQEVQTGFAGKEWNRQSLWREKRDAYAKLIAAGHAVLNMLYSKADVKQLWDEFSLADSYARLFASRACLEELDAYWATRYPWPGKSLEVQANDTLLFVNAIIDIAKADLSSERLTPHK